MNPTNPQSWNRYAYVGNNPLIATDPSGLCNTDTNPGCTLGAPGELTTGVSDKFICPTEGCPRGNIRSDSDDVFAYENSSDQAISGIVSGGGLAMPSLDSSGTVSDLQMGQGVSVGSGTFDPATGRDTSDVVIGNNAAALAPAMNAGASFVNRSVANMTIGGITGGVIGSALGHFIGGFVEGYTSHVRTGMQLWRVFGGEARGMGMSWTSMNPANVPNYRVAAGLYPGNSGAFVLRGTLNNTEGVLFRSALAGPGGIGGGGIPEIVVPNPMVQINIDGVWGINPPF